MTVDRSHLNKIKPVSHQVSFFIFYKYKIKCWWNSTEIVWIFFKNFQKLQVDLSKEKLYAYTFTQKTFMEKDITIKRIIVKNENILEVKYFQ